MSDTYRLPEHIETERYLLRRIADEDAAPIFEAYATDAAVTRYLGWRPHRTVDETAAFIRRVAREWESGAGCPLVVFARDAPDRLIGMFHPHIRGLTVNYGYVLRADAWGKGCASEVLRRLVDHALGHPLVHRAEAFCDCENRASARVMEKAGMTFEGVLRRYFVHPNVSKTPRDCAIYSKVH